MKLYKTLAGLFGPVTFCNRALALSSAAALLLSLPLSVTAATFYVDVNNLAPAFPYTNWVTAAANIQDAVDVAVAGDLIQVTNGVYQTGARAVYGMSNRVAVTKPVTVQSINGATVTSIVGYQVPDATNGAAAVRCVYLTNGAVLAGFTLTHGATQISSDSLENQSGGGVWCESGNAVVSNCVLAGNSADLAGGGAYSGTLNNCTLTGNWAQYGGGAAEATLNNCSLTDNWADCGGGTEYSTLNNCTLAGNWATYGGGAYYATLNHSTLAANWADSGGGADGCALDNCTLTGNWADYGGGAEVGTLNNCTLTGNWAQRGGGGADWSTLNNCIVYYNSAPLDGNYSEGTLNYCCTIPLPAAGTGNLTAEPQLASVSHLSAGSPCRGAGSADYATDSDVDGEPWANPPSMGCDEYWSGSVTGALSAVIVVAYTNVAVGFAVDLQAVIAGRVSESRWDFGDGVVVSNRPYASHAWGVAGDYVVELRAYNDSYPGGVAATVTLHVMAQPVHYVALSSPAPAPPYSSWATAATNIQDAVDAATVPGALVWVTNGVYEAGAREVYGMSNRVAVTKPVTVQSTNGPEVTLIVGYQMPGTTNGAAAVRCVYLTNGAVLAGFTLTNGATQAVGDDSRQRSGGGIWCEFGSTIVSNCVLAGNSAYSYGGGARFGTLTNCTLTGNSAQNGGAATEATLNNCKLTGNWADYGGGTFSSLLSDCTLTANSAQYGGAAYSGSFINCMLSNNSAQYSGGGTYFGTLNGCTLTGNSAQSGGGAAYATLNKSTLSENSAEYGGGATEATLNKSALTGNSALSDGGGAYSGTLTNCTLSGNSAQNGGGAANAMLNNCALTGNSAACGGGASGGTLNNCTLSQNSASDGGGTCGGALNRCTLTGNSASNGGGGVSGGTIDNCTLTGNWAEYGGGAEVATLNNCIVYYNRAPSGANYDQSTLNYCCTTPLPATGTGNLTAEPQLASVSHLSAGSPCRGAGSADYATDSDVDGEPWANPPSMGCDEYWSGSVTGAPSAVVVVAYTNVAVGFALDLRAVIAGRVSESRWDFGDGVVVSNRPYASHAWGVAGDYVVEL